jgi:hypothetical protein
MAGIEGAGEGENETKEITRRWTGAGVERNK